MSVPYWYQACEKGQEYEEALGVSAGIDHGYVFNHGRSRLSLAYKFTDYNASPSLDTRVANRATIAITQQFRPAFYGQLTTPTNTATISTMTGMTRAASSAQALSINSRKIFPALFPPHGRTTARMSALPPTATSA